MKLSNTSVRVLKRLIATFYVSALVVQLLVVLKVIPFDWVNGGMSKTYEIQLVQSLVSLVIISALFRFVWRLLCQDGNVKKWKLRALYAITAFWFLGLLMQIAGTEFERYFLSFSLLLGVVSHGILVSRIRSTINL